MVTSFHFVLSKANHGKQEAIYYLREWDSNKSTNNYSIGNGREDLNHKFLLVADTLVARKEKEK